MDIAVCLLNILLFSYASAKYLEDRRCNTTSDCMPNTICQNNLCTCKENFVPIRESSKTECVEVTTNFGGPCTFDIQCSIKFGARAECQKTSSTSTGQCACQKGSHFQDGICYESARIGAHCLVNDNCISLSNVSTYCYESKCVCAPNYESNIDGTDCVLIKNTGDIGSQCSNNDSCVPKHSACIADICRCKPDHVISQDRKACLTVVDQLGGGCTEDTQCTALMKHTYCDPIVQGCQCLRSTRQINGSCWITAKLGESCNNIWECDIPSEAAVVCDNQICKCKSGYKMNALKTDCEGKASLLKYSNSLLYLIVVLVVILNQCSF